MRRARAARVEHQRPWIASRNFIVQSTWSLAQSIIIPLHSTSLMSLTLELSLRSVWNKDLSTKGVRDAGPIPEQSSIFGIRGTKQSWYKQPLQRLKAQHTRGAIYVSY